MRFLKIDNYRIETPIPEILDKLQSILTNGKLRDIKPGDENYVVTCPEHSGGVEHKPACNIYIGDDTDIPYGFCRCFVCGFKGPFEYFVSKCMNCSEEVAKRWLIDNFGTLDHETISLGAPISLNKKKQVRKINKAALDQFQSWTPYLSKRKLSRPVCEKLDVRYDTAARQVVFPCFDEDNNLVMMPRRSIDSKIFYLDKNVDKPLYCVNQIVKHNITKFMVVEGPIDCLTCWTHKVPAVAVMGQPSDEQIESLNKLGATFIYIATDNDEWGEKFANMISSKLKRNIFRIRIQLPFGRKDVNDLTTEEWDELIKKYNLPQFDICK